MKRLLEKRKKAAMNAVFEDLSVYVRFRQLAHSGAAFGETVFERTKSADNGSITFWWLFVFGGLCSPSGPRKQALDGKGYQAVDLAIIPDRSYRRSKPPKAFPGRQSLLPGGLGRASTMKRDSPADDQQQTAHPLQILGSVNQSYLAWCGWWPRLGFC